jgi:DNA-directed RNA polymerase specialized sigma subunit
MNIAEKIRKMLLNIDLKIVYAEGEKKVAIEDFRFNQKIDTSKNQQLAMQAKARKECYSIYINNLVETKRNINFQLDKILDKYLPERRKIWELYFLQNKSVKKIAEELNLEIKKVQEIIKKLNEDLGGNTVDIR